MLDIGVIPKCEFMDFDSVSVHKHPKKERVQYPAILTSRLGNNQRHKCRQKHCYGFFLNFHMI